jgi:hypothetical protein
MQYHMTCYFAYMAIEEGSEVLLQQNVNSVSEEEISGKSDELEMVESDEGIEDEQEGFQEVDEKKDQGFFAALFSFIKSIISLFSGDDEKEQDVERKPAHSQATEGELIKSRGKSHDIELQNQKVEEMYNALDKLNAQIQKFEDQKGRLEEKNTTTKLEIQSDMSKEDSGNEKEQKDKAREILQNKQQIEKLNLRIATLMKTHQKLLDKIQDVFCQEDEQEVRDDVMKGLEEIEQDVNDMMQQIEAEIYQERLENLNNAITQNNQGIESIETDLANLMQSISIDNQNGQDQQDQFNQLLNKKESLIQENQSNQAIVGILMQDAKESGFVKSLKANRANVPDNKLSL